jgi:diaminohydroxyphosphoribosylaminopyrimidine deaminase / 5-amino-6-(5-phosphoribosylamino)uracil reductase
MALADAGERRAGATAFVTLEPCAHESHRGPAVRRQLIAAGIARAVVAMPDPDPRRRAGHRAVKAAGIAVTKMCCERTPSGNWLGLPGRLAHGRPELTLKLALSLDGRLARKTARASGSPAGRPGPMPMRFAPRRTWCSWAAAPFGPMRHADGAPFRQHRAAAAARRADAARSSPKGTSGSQVSPRSMLWQGNAGSTASCARAAGALASALLAADRVDRLVLLRAPILIGNGIGLEGLAPASLDETHGRWLAEDRRPLGLDLLECYRRAR